MSQLRSILTRTEFSGILHRIVLIQTHIQRHPPTSKHRDKLPYLNMSRGIEKLTSF
ncbi:hypothetical protein I79_025409 [Cricetulus griseus]|uniref:Uncharacterized protein n=1 Tax=Cricetulus griseus TaxID=10029 RepID=G3IN97_CRIGR|nr:hypothetical protein I79_025409 [Cricetulus griseus]